MKFIVRLRIFAFPVLLSACPLAGFADEAAPVVPLPVFTTPADQSAHEARAAWYAGARLGMFIHWGLWRGGSEWGMFHGNIPAADYRERAKTFTGEKFDAKAIVALAKASGMNYITFVAKHHDGFCLWDTAFSDFNSMKSAASRDFVKELSDACKEAKMPLIIYYSLGLDWMNSDFLTRKQYLYARPKNAASEASAKAWTPEKFENYRSFCKNQLEEISRKYEVAGFWFDPLGAELANPGLFNVEEVYNHIRKVNPGALILNKTGITGTEDVVVGERELASIAMHYGAGDEQSRRIRTLADAAWKLNRFKKAEICVTSQGTWGWTPNSKCLSSEKLAGMLKLAAKNNANLLLNFGPEPSGAIPADVDREFRALGEIIRRDGYPEANVKTWKELRTGKGEVLDSNEETKTAR